MANTKKCPYCGEKIKAEAKKCRYCGEWLDKEENEYPEKKFVSDSQEIIDNSPHKSLLDFNEIGEKRKKYWLIGIISIIIIIIGSFGLNSYHSKMIMQRNTIIIDSAMNQLESKCSVIARFPDKKRHCAYYYVPHDSVMYRFDAINKTSEVFNLGLHKGEGDDFALNNIDTAFVNPQGKKIILITRARGDDYQENTNYLLIDTYSMTVDNIAISKSYDIKVKKNIINVYSDKYVHYIVSCDGAEDSTSVIDSYDFNGKKQSSATENITDGKHNKEDFSNYEILLDASKDDNRHCIYYVNKKSCIKYDINTKMANTIISCGSFHPNFLNKDICATDIESKYTSKDGRYLVFIMFDSRPYDYVRYDTYSNNYLFIGAGYGPIHSHSGKEDVIYFPETKALNGNTARYTYEYRWANRYKVMDMDGKLLYYTQWASN